MIADSSLSEKDEQRKRRKKIVNSVLFILFMSFLVILITYTVAVHSRTVMKTDTISKKEIYDWGGGSGSRNNKYFFSHKEYLLERRYFVIPTIQVLIEKSKIDVGDEISYFVDSKEIEKYQNNPIKTYTPIGVAVGESCPTGIWYWLSLLSYVLKNTLMAIANFILVLVVAFHFKPLTRIDRVFFRSVIIYFIFWGFVL